MCRAVLRHCRSDTRGVPTVLNNTQATVYALNDYTGWANTNGFCLSWPPVRAPRPFAPSLT